MHVLTILSMQYVPNCNKLRNMAPKTIVYVINSDRHTKDN